MTLNSKLAVLAGTLVTGLTLIISLSTTFWLIIFGSALLVVGFSVLSAFDGFVGSFNKRYWLYIIPMIATPTIGGFLSGTNLSVWVGAPVAVLGGFLTHQLIWRYPLVQPEDQYERALPAGHIS